VPHERTPCSGYGETPDENLAVLLQLCSKLNRAPEGWDGKSFGPIWQRGWIKSLGTGAWSDNWAESEVVQSSVGPWLAALHGRPVQMQKVERVSVKVPGCPALAPHIDTARAGSYQVIIVGSLVVRSRARCRVLPVGMDGGRTFFE
jgi:hypothetical protein